MEELLEDSVICIWPGPSPSGILTSKSPKATATNARSVARSSPISILDRKTGNWRLSERFDSGGDEELEEGILEDEMVPPHVIIERRFCGGDRKTAFSVCTGNGRTLKGRDLRKVRNSVLKETGFLEGRSTF